MFEITDEERLAEIRKALKTGAIVQVSPRRIAVREGRRPIDPGALAQLKESIAKLGMLNPITAFVVEREEKGEVLPFFTLAAGLHRLQAAIELDLETIPVRLVPGEDAVLVEIVENLDRAELSAVERLELLGKAAQMLKERRKRNPNSTRLGAISGRRGPKLRGRPGSGGSRHAAHILGATRADTRRAERFGSLDPEAREAIKRSAKLKNSSEAIDVLAKVPSGEQVAFIERLEQAERLRDITREPRQVERYDAGSSEPVTTGPEIMSPITRKTGRESVTARAYQLMNDFGREGAEALFMVSIKNLDAEFLTQRAGAEIAAEIARRGMTPS